MTTRLEQLREKYGDGVLPLDRAPIVHRANENVAWDSVLNTGRYATIHPHFETAGYEAFLPRPEYEQRRELYGDLTFGRASSEV